MEAKFVYESLSQFALKYKNAAEKYKPNKIKTLLIGEAPPPPTEKNPNPNYFYITPSKFTGHNASLPGRVFTHYFGSYAKGKEDYANKLEKLRDNGIFMIDIVEEPITVKKSKLEPEIPESVEIIKNSLPKLKERIKELGVSEENVIFLIPSHRSYRKDARRMFPNSKFPKGWKEFSEINKINTH
jgi:hypothetical protein